ncbi:MAG: hypothetical protein PWQ97_1207 [Tepidanaerobacteraceae bacterium]|nr:hypothetical protein [Tepidanaerobacteraceae bacterium]
MTIVVDDERKGSGVQNPVASPQQDRKRNLLIIGDIIAIIGTSLLLATAILDFLLDTAFRE